MFCVLARTQVGALSTDACRLKEAVRVDASRLGARAEGRVVDAVDGGLKPAR